MTQGLKLTGPVQLKRSSQAGFVPTPAELLPGELAINIADKKLFAKGADGSIFALGDKGDKGDTGDTGDTGVISGVDARLATEVIGTVAPIGTGSVTAAGVRYGWVTAATVSGVIERVRVGVSSAQMGVIEVCSVNGDGSLNLVRSAPINLVVGLNDILVDIPVLVGHVVVLALPAGGLRYNGQVGLPNYFSVATQISISTPKSVGAGQRLEFGVTLSGEVLGGVHVLRARTDVIESKLKLPALKPVTIVPPNNLGSDGDIAVDVNLMRLHGPKAAGVWPPKFTQMFGTTASATTLITNRAPTALDDSSKGYAAGSKWLNRATGLYHTATSVAAGAAVWTSASLPATLLLDAVPTAAAAYGVTRLRAAYAGNALQVRRASDSTTLDVGFVGNVADWAAVDAFVAGTTGRISIWYDQSGNGLNATGSATAGPEITFNTVNGVRAIDFGTNGAVGIYESLTLPAGLSLTRNSYSVVSAIYPTAPAAAALAICVNGTDPSYLNNSLFLCSNTGKLQITANAFPVFHVAEAGPQALILASSATGTTVVSNETSSTGVALGAGTLTGGAIGIYTGYVFLGSLAAMAFYPRALDATERLAAKEWVYQTLKVTPQVLDRLVLLGDNITAGFDADPALPWSRQMQPFVSERAYKIYNQGSGGQTAAWFDTNFAANTAPLKAAAVRNALIVSLGTNDISAGTSASAVYASITSIVTKARAAGFAVVSVATVLPRQNTGLAGGGPAFEVVRLALNTLIRQNTAAVDHVIDIGADPVMGPYAAAADTTLYNGALHPKAAGAAILAPHYAGAINASDRPTLTGAPGGTSGAIQYNNGGAFAAVPGFSWDGTKLNVGSRINLTGADGNTIYGAGGAGGSLTSGVENIVSGIGAMTANATLSGLIAIGAFAQAANVSGYRSVAVGDRSQQFNVSGIANVSFGNYTLRYNTTGEQNTVIGDSGMQNNISGSYCALVGVHVGENNISGHGLAGIGHAVCTANTTGTYNSGLGFNALRWNTVGSFNAAGGFTSLENMTAGNYNTAFGADSLKAFLTGNGNVAFGAGSAPALTSGEYNLFAGRNCGAGLVNGSNNTLLGSRIAGLAAGLSNAIVIADGSGNQRIDHNKTVAGAWSIHDPVIPKKLTVAALPAGVEGMIAYAMDGRKVGQGAGAGTGVPVYFSGGAWRMFSTDAAVAA